MSTYDQWKTREDPEPRSDDECRYCEEARRENAQVVEINEALRDQLADAVKALKRADLVYSHNTQSPTAMLIRAAITAAEILLGGRS